MKIYIKTLKQSINYKKKWDWRLTVYSETNASLIHSMSNR